MKNTAVLCLLAICLAFAAFTGGFFLGRNVNHTEVQHSQQTVESTSAPGQKLDINTATAAQLQSLPGVGPTLAGRIVEYRLSHGLFTTTEQLLLVEGIGETLLETISEFITAGG